MNWQKKIRPLVLGLLSAIFIVWSGASLAADQVSTRDFVRIGDNITVQENQIVRDAVAVGGNVTLLEGGRVTGDAVAVGGDVSIKADALLAGDAVAIGGEVLAEEGAIIEGSEVEIFSGAKVLVSRLGLFGTIYLANLAFYIISLLVVFAFGIFLLLLLPGHLQTISSTISQHPFKSGMWGLGGIIAAILCTSLITGSVLGVVLIPVVNLLVLVTGLLGCTGTGLWVGEKIYSTRSSSLLKEFFVGMLILGLISLIPVAGGLIVLMVNLFGFGAVLLSRFGTVQAEVIEKRFDQAEGIAH